MFHFIAEMDRHELWRDAGARDMAHWLWMRQGISDWKARRWIAAAHVLERLPGVSGAFSRGELPIDKVVELTGSRRPRPSQGSSPGPRTSRAAASGTKGISQP